MKRYTLVFGALLLSLLFGAPAQAACTSPAGESGDFQFKSSDKKLYSCNGSTWSLVTNVNDNSKYYLTDGFPIVGAGGGNVIKPCPTQEAGEPCGGGLYVGDGNLVASPGGCYDNYTESGPANFHTNNYQARGSLPYTACPTDFEHRDFRYMRYSSGTSGQTAAAAFGAQYAATSTTFSRRYGWAQTQVFKAMSGADIFKFCANMSITTTENGVSKTYSDWYVPTAYELSRVIYAMARIGGSGYGNTQNGNYWSANEAGTSGGVIQANVAIPLTETGYIGNLNAGLARDQTNRIRCVRRN